MKKTLEKVEKVAKYYEKIGYKVMKTFIDDEKLPEMLKPIIEGKTTVLAGQSGVGKSTLLNTVLPSLGFENRRNIRSTWARKAYDTSC